MSRASVVVLALLTLPPLAHAQDGFGLDLSDEGKQPTEQQSQEQSQEQQAPPSRPAPPAPEASSPGGEPTATGMSEVERDITLDDRVKSVQRKVYLKRHRFELAPAFAFSVNDPFYNKLGAGLRGGYYLADTLALAARFSVFQTLKNEDARTAQGVFFSRIYNSVPEWTGTADVEWSPVYGKVAFLNDILHFDAYVLGGAGVVRTATSEKRGLNPAADLGVGARFVARDFLAVNVALINTFYVDQPAGTIRSATQNLMTINAGISVFFPFSSTGREAE